MKKGGPKIVMRGAETINRRDNVNFTKGKHEIRCVDRSKVCHGSWRKSL